MTRQRWNGRIDETMRLRFFVYVEETDSCHLWRGGLSDKGYGIFVTEGRTRVKAHRFSFLLYRGVIPAGMVVCHRCDNPACVRPEHLFLGTVLVNNLDRTEKGRGATGETHGGAKLTWDRVRELRRLIASGRSAAEVAALMHLSSSHVRRVARGAYWRGGELRG